MQAESASPFPIAAPDGSTIEIPVAVDPATDPYLALTTPEAIRAYFDREGYVVVRSLLPTSFCDELVAGFQQEVKPARGFFKRQSAIKPQKHVFTPQGHLLNPILHPHDLPRDLYPRFRDATLRAVTHPQVQRTMARLMDDPGQLIQTMYFEGNPETWAHHDSYYIDAERIGAMVGCWIALEDIEPGAGRFFVCPRSHRTPLPVYGQETDRDPHGPGYAAWVLETVRSHGLTFRAPAMRKGDALFWPSTTIHGSLPTVSPDRSRQCVTTHYIPRGQAILTLHQRLDPTSCTVINGVPVHFHGAMDNPRRRLMWELKCRFPHAYALARQLKPRFR